MGKQIGEMQSYKELKVWQKSVDLALSLYKAALKFPKDELYGLSSQIKRAAVAIPSNIAEGFTRQHTAEYIQFLKIAFSSGAELETQLLIANKLGFLSEKEFYGLSADLSEIMRMLNGLIQKLKTSR